MRNVIEMQEIEITEDEEQTVDIWANFGEFKNLKEAKETAKKLVTEIRNHTCPAVFEIAGPSHFIGIVISQYYEFNRGPLKFVQSDRSYMPGSIKDVIDIDMIPPEEWN